MKKKNIIFLLLLGANTVYAQGVITIKGHIVGDQSNDYLPYCSVQLKHSSVAVASNDNGDFELHIDKSQSNDTLMILYIGYYVFMEPIEKILFENTHLFKLKEKPFVLNEVVIGPAISVKEVIKKIYENFKTNYIQSGFYLDGFFRAYEKRNNKCNTLIEAAITVKSTGFNTRKKQWNRSDAYLKEVRSTYYTGPMDTVDVSNIINSILLAYEKNIDNDLGNNETSLSIEKTEYKGNDKIISLTYNTRDTAHTCTISGIFRINSTDWSIIEFDAEKKFTGKKIVQLSPDSLKARDYSHKFKCSYNKFNGRYYLCSIYWQATRDIISPRETTLTEFHAEYVTNKIYFNSPPDILKNDIINRNTNLYKQVWQKPYHPEFWKTYNLIVDNPELEKIKNDLNSKGNVNEQFNNANKYPAGSKKVEK